MSSALAQAVTARHVTAIAQPISDVSVTIQLKQLIKSVLLHRSFNFTQITSFPWRNYLYWLQDHHRALRLHKRQQRDQVTPIGAHFALVLSAFTLVFIKLLSQASSWYFKSSQVISEAMSSSDQKCTCTPTLVTISCAFGLFIALYHVILLPASSGHQSSFRWSFSLYP